MFGSHLGVFELDACVKESLGDGPYDTPEKG